MLIEQLLDFLYPNVCGICKKISKKSLCSKCKIQINDKVQFQIRTYMNKNFSEHAYFFCYEGELRNLLLSYKFFEQAYLYRFFSEIVLQSQEACEFYRQYDIIIPVPLHKKRKQERGYNQSELIAKQISKQQNMPIFQNNVLYKIKATVPQSSLTLEERKQNVKNVYQVQNQGILKNKKVLLLDDIYTTGNTVNECSRILKQYETAQIRSNNFSKRLNRIRRE